MSDEATHDVYRHRDGTTCILVEDGTWFVPYDVGGEGVACEQEHASPELARLLAQIEALHGTFAPGEQVDGYLPGAWDEVRSAYMDGHISEQAYTALHAVIGNQPNEGTT
jgi:hypothetical protein